jgi:hypothetical protein
MVTIKKKTIVNTQTVKSKKSKYTTRKSKLITKKDSKKGRKEQRRCKTTRKQQNDSS